MALPRRRLVRTAIPAASPPVQQRREQAIRARLARERATLARWQTRLKRAFNAVQKSQRTVTRLERQLRTLEG